MSDPSDEVDYSKKRLVLPPSDCPSKLYYENVKESEPHANRGDHQILPRATDNNPKKNSKRGSFNVSDSSKVIKLSEGSSKDSMDKGCLSTRKKGSSILFALFACNSSKKSRETEDREKLRTNTSPELTPSFIPSLLSFPNHFFETQESENLGSEESMPPKIIPSNKTKYIAQDILETSAKGATFIGPSSMPDGQFVKPKIQDKQNNNSDCVCVTGKAQPKCSPAPLLQKLIKDPLDSENTIPKGINNWTKFLGELGQAIDRTGDLGNLEEISPKLICEFINSHMQNIPSRDWSCQILEIISAVNQLVSAIRRFRPEKQDLQAQAPSKPHSELREVSKEMGVRMEVVERDLFEQACQSPSENRSYCILLSESSISISNSVSLPPAVMQQTPPSGQNSISLQPDVLDFNCAERKGKYTENCEMMELSVCKEAFIEPRISPAVKTVSVRTEQSKMNCNDSLHTSIAINSSINLNKCHFSEGEGLSFPSNIQNYLPRVNEKLGDIPETMDASHSTPTQPFFALQEAYEFKPLSSANSSTTLSIQDQGLEPEYNPQLGRRKARSKEFSIVPSRSIWNSSQIPCRAVRDKSNGSCHNEQPLRRSMRKESRQKSNPARKKPSYSLIDRIFRVTFAGSDFPENRYRNNGLSSSIHLDRLEESRCRAKQRTQNGTNKYCSSTQLFIETSARLQDMRENHVSQASRVKYKDKIRDKPRQRMDLNIGGSKHKTLRRQAPIKYAIESIRKDFEPIHQTTSLMGLNKKQNINQAQNNRTSITGFTESTSLSHTYDARLREYNAKNIRNANVKTVDATEKPECNLRKIEVEANEICENTNNNNISNQLDTNDKNEDGGSNRSKNQIESQPGQKAACSVTSPVMAVDKKELDQAEEMRIATNEFSILSPTTEHFQPKDQPASGSSISGSLSIVVTPDVRNDNSAEARPIGLGQPTARMESSGQEEHTTDQMLEFSSSRASEPDSDVTLDSADQLPGHLILTPWLRPALRQPLLLPEHLANAYRVNLGTNGQILAHANIYPHTMYAHPHSHPHQQQQTPIISSLSSPVQSGLNQIQHVPSHAHLYPHVVDQRNINIGLISEDGAVPISWTYSVGQVGRLGGLGCGDDGTNRRALLEHQALRLGELGFFSFDQPWDSRGSNSQIGSLSGLYTGYSRSTTLPSVHETSSLENVQTSDDNYESVFEGLLSVFHTRNEHEPDVAFEPTQTAITEITVLRGTSGHLGQVEQIGSMQETDETGMVTVHSIHSEIISSMPLFTPTTPSHSTVTASTSHLRHGLLDSSASACLVTLSQPLPLVPASLPVLGQQHQDSPMVSATPTTSSPSGMSGLPLTVPATSIFRHQGKHGAIHHSPAAP